jgi:hypothetical protein
MRRFRPLLLALVLLAAVPLAAQAATRTSTAADAAGATVPATATATATAPAAATPPATTPAPGPTYTPNPAASDDAIGAAAASTGRGDAGTPLPLVLLGVLGALMVLAALLLGAARWWAWDPRWLQRTRHAGAEAGWRAGAAWEEFTDWLRLGR